MKESKYKSNLITILLFMMELAKLNKFGLHYLSYEFYYNFEVAQPLRLVKGNFNIRQFTASFINQSA